MNEYEYGSSENDEQGYGVGRWFDHESQVWRYKGTNSIVPQAAWVETFADTKKPADRVIDRCDSCEHTADAYFGSSGEPKEYFCLNCYLWIELGLVSWTEYF